MGLRVPISKINFCSRVLRLSDLSKCKERPQIAICCLEWLGKSKCLATGFDASLSFPVANLHFQLSWYNQITIVSQSVSQSVRQAGRKESRQQPWVSYFIIQSVNQSIHQLLIQKVRRVGCQPVSQCVNILVSQLLSQSVSQSVSQSIHQLYIQVVRQASR